MRKLDLDALDNVNGGLDVRSLQNHLGAPSVGGDPFHNNAFIGGPAAVPAGAHPIDPSQGTYFDPYGAPGHPTGVVSDPYHTGYPSLSNPYVYQAPPPLVTGSTSPSINIPGIVGAVPGLLNALGSGNPAGAIPGIVNIVGNATGTNLGGLGSVLGQFTNALGGGGSGGNPLGGLGGLLGGGGQQGGGDPFGGGGGFGGGGDPFGGGFGGGGDPFGGGGDFGGGGFGF